MSVSTEPKPYHALDPAAVLSAVSSSRQGLRAAEAAERIARFGPNELAEKAGVSPWMLWLEQFKNFLIIILLIGVILSGILGEVTDAVLIFVIVLFATLLGFIQEYRAERAMAALKKMAAPTATVVRDDREVEVPARELVPGDVVILRTGDRVPADVRLLEAVNLRAEESSLTGESVPSEKSTDAVPAEANVGDRRDMVFLGTAVVYGRGIGVVTTTGMQTEFGRIAKMLQEVKPEPTPLQVNLDKMGRIIAYGALALTFILALLGILRGNEVLDMIVWGISLAVAAVPEALPAVVTISLALGVQKMVRRHALVRRLPSVETLGATTVICTDKTGTLTQDQMTVRRVYVDGKLLDVSGAGYEPKGGFTVGGAPYSPESDSALLTMLRIGALCGDTDLVQEDGSWKIKGDPTEGALVVLAAKAGLWENALDAESPRVGEIPFSSETKRMTTVHQTPRGRVAYSKGAPEVVLGSCRYVLSSGQEKPMTDADRDRVQAAGQGMAENALRVLGLSYKKLPEGAAIGPDTERDMVFVGLAGMIDPPRAEAKAAVKICDEAGIKTVMITGDHKLTAVAIARELGILKDGLALTGAELDKIDAARFDEMVDNVEVYARVSPAHKLRVVEALSKKGHVVAMTGDGVNDAPALKRADIGVAMGVTGTDVTKEAADMVLTDDNFASIVAAVEEGRGIYGNIKKYLVYLLSCNLGEILLMAVAILFGPLLGLPSGLVPLVAVQILFVNLATDGLPAIALSVDPPDRDLMKQRPRKRNETIFTGAVTLYMTLVGIWTGLVTLGVFVWATKTGHPEAQSMTFVTLILIEFFNAFNCRSLDQSAFKAGILRNRWLLAAIASQVVLLLLIVYVPALQGPFRTHALTLADWGVTVGASASVFVIVELVKLAINLVRRRRPA